VTLAPASQPDRGDRFGVLRAGAPQPGFLHARDGTRGTTRWPTCPRRVRPPGSESRRSAGARSRRRRIFTRRIARGRGWGWTCP
jgi:hypothetical protein